MGEVWRASKDDLEKPFVVKVLLPELAKDPAHRRRFLREAKLVAELPLCPIVPVVDYGEADGRLYLVMAYVDGVNLQTFCDALSDKGVRLPFPVVVYILTQVLEGLQVAHDHVREGRARAIVHRDIKPSNVLISSRGLVFLTDFGIAQYDSDFSMETFGSLRYIAPEQARGHARPQPQCDIFGVGGLAHFMLTGQPPRQVNTAVQLVHVLDNPPPSTGRSDIPAELEDLRVRALQPSPEHRPQTALECIKGIQAWPGSRVSARDVEHIYRPLFGGPRTGMSEMFAMARADRSEPTASLSGEADAEAANDDWHPWWSDESEDEPSPPSFVEPPSAESPPATELRGIPAEYLPLTPPDAEREPDAPRIRRRPRRTPSPPEAAVQTERLPPPGTAPSDARSVQDGDT